MPRLLSVAKLRTPMGSGKLANGASPGFEAKLEKSPERAVQGGSELHISVKRIAREDQLLRPLGASPGTYMFPGLAPWAFLRRPLFWLWLMGRLAWDSLRIFRSLDRDTPPGTVELDRRPAMVTCIAALGAWVALLVAGMFEYNFGDSEVLTLFLFLMSAPYAVCARNWEAKPE